MNIVLFSHPQFLGSQSMPRFAKMLASAYEARGHTVTLWSPTPRWHRRFAGSKYAKWAGYVDQYVWFPLQVRKALRTMPEGTLFVFCDQALGPWVPLVRSRPHVVHVHDLLALRSALGDIRENPTAWSGRLYQRYIRRGFRTARHFISVSKKTREDLHRFGRVNASSSDVVYNGLNYPYGRMAPEEALQVLEAEGFPARAGGMLLHLGGNQWYKNQRGVIAIYARYAADATAPLELWCIGPQPGDAIKEAVSRIGAPGRVRFFQNISNRALQAAYSSARAFLFPSLAEGFGWPLVEAAACGCPVITTGEPPMNEVAGDSAYYLPRLQYGEDIGVWAIRGASLLHEVLAASPAEREERLQRARAWVNNFNPERCIEAYLRIYRSILEKFPCDGAELSLDRGSS